MFSEVKNETFDEREKRILQFWIQERIFEQSVKERQDRPHFVFYDGPPFATGLPHYGHLLAGTIKDVIPRYKTMKGFCVPRRFGWDCHGLPVENEIEKSFELSGAQSIETFGIARFNEECRSIVLRYTEEWKTTVLRMGRWVDFEQTYRTMDQTFMESVWWAFQQLYKKGLVYEGYKVMPFSAKLGTPLSNFEASENYKDVDDPSLTLAFPLVDEPDTEIWAWTTTPWSLISNLALMVGPEVDYVKVRDHASGKNAIIAKSRLSHYYPDPSTYTEVDHFKGKTLESKRYKPAFDYFAHKGSDGSFRVILEDSVSIEDGTGVVQCAPAFGEVDFFACQRANIELVCPVNSNGRFTDEIPEYAGLFVKDADKDIIKRLKVAGRVIRHETIRHRYPFCWRSDTPLIYKVVRTWFVAVEKIKDRLLAANDQIHWMPDFIKSGRFGKWLEGARDWAISRNRYWGTPIPLWRAEDGELLAIGSITELETLTKSKVVDLHRQYVDDLVILKDGKEFRRIPEVFDCWFESGSMPYAQNHYPFENREFFDLNFPADFIAEGIDQTRGWFYTLTVLAAGLFDKPAFKNVIVNGLVLAEDGSKMSKRLRNYPDPQIVIEKFGADAIRLYMLDSPAVRADDLCFSEKGVELILRQVLIPFWNAYSFFVTYARIYKWTPPKSFTKPDAEIDRWAISKLHELIHEVESGLDDYDLNRAVKPLVGFVDQLTNWYIRRSRRRFWNEEDSPDRQQAFETLYQVLVELSKGAAPFMPFLTEAIYRNLRTDAMPISVQLCAYPTYVKEKRDQVLEAGMEAIQRAVSLGHALRKEHKLKVRQPLPVAHLASGSSETLSFLQEQKHLIADELNVKEVLLSDDEERFVRLKAKPNFRVLGKKVGKAMNAVHKAVEALDQKQLSSFMEGQPLTISVDGQTFALTSDDVQVEREVKEGLIAANEGHMTIALDTTLTEDLLIEGLMREIINKINTMRREAGFAVTDRIEVVMQTTDRVKMAFEKYRDEICGEVLATSVHFGPCEGTSWDLNGESTIISLQKL